MLVHLSRSHWNCLFRLYTAAIDAIEILRLRDAFTSFILLSFVYSFCGIFLLLVTKCICYLHQMLREKQIYYLNFPVQHNYVFVEQCQRIFYFYFYFIHRSGYSYRCVCTGKKRSIRFPCFLCRNSKYIIIITGNCKCDHMNLILIENSYYYIIAVSVAVYRYLNHINK